MKLAVRPPRDGPGFILKTRSSRESERRQKRWIVRAREIGWKKGRRRSRTEDEQSSFARTCTYMVIPRRAECREFDATDERHKSTPAGGKLRNSPHRHGRTDRIFLAGLLALTVKCREMHMIKANGSYRTTVPYRRSASSPARGRRTINIDRRVS